MTPRVFIDTSFLLALQLRDDARHTQAAALLSVFEGDCITTDFVLIEVLDAFARPPSREIAGQIVRAIRARNRIVIVPASASLIARGFELFLQRADKTWGITDCISFVVMNDNGITDALTADRHFEQAGFKALLRPAE